MDFSCILIVGSAGTTALPSSQTPTSVGHAAQDRQWRRAQQGAEAAAACFGWRGTEHAFDRTSRMQRSGGYATKPASCKSAHREHMERLRLAAERRDRRAERDEGAPRVRGTHWRRRTRAARNTHHGIAACPLEVRDTAAALCERPSSDA